MSEYIEREDLLELYRMDDPVLNKNGHVPLPVIRQNIMDIPAADVAPVRHGRWVEPACLYYGAKQYECSLCHSDTFWRKHSITEKYPCCPNCGCRMDGGDDE